MADPVYTDDQISTAIQSYRKAHQPAAPSTVDQPPPEPAEPQGQVPPWADPSNLQAAEFGRHYAEETQDPLGAAGERGEPIAPGENPYAPLQQVDPAEDARITKAIQNYRQAHGPNIFQQMRAFDWTLQKRVVEDAATIGTYGIQGVAGAMTMFEAPSLNGKSIDQVRELRDQMVESKAQVDRQLDTLMDSGQVNPRVDNTAGSASTIGALSTRSSNLAERIQQADGIIASGQAQFTAPSEGAAVDFLRSRSNAPEVVKNALDQAFPTDADFANTWVGKVSTLGADAATLGAASLLGAGIPALTGFMGGSTYQDAKAHGASDHDAENAALMSGITTLATAPVMEAGIGALAKRFAGLTPKQGIAQILSGTAQFSTRTLGAGGEMTAYQLQNNAIAKLSGYDPNRSLDQGTWESFWMGIGFGAFTQAAGQIPRLARLNKPDVTVRNKSGTPPDTGPTTEAPPPPPTEPNVPGGTIAPTAPTEAEAKATSAVQQNVGQAPEIVLANAGDPKQKLLDTINTLAPETTEEPAAGVPAPQPNVQAQTEAQLGRPLETADQLAQAHADIVAEMEQRMREGQPQIGGAPPPTTEQARAAAPTVTPETPTVELGGTPAVITDPATGQVLRAEPSTQPSSTGLAEMGGQMGGAISKNMRDMLWSKFEKGDTTEAGAPSNLLTLAAFGKKAGRITTRQEFEDFVTRYGESLKANQPVNAFAAAEERRGAAAPYPPSTPAETRPAETAPAAATATKAAPTGYRVSWLDHEADPNNPRYRAQVFRTKKQVQEQLRNLKNHNVTQVSTESLHEPKAWYENFPQSSPELQGYSQQELTQARADVEKGFRDAGKNPDMVVNTEWTAAMKSRLQQMRGGAQEAAIAAPAAAEPTGFKPPVQPAKSQVLDSAKRARWETWDSLTTAQQNKLKANDPKAIAKFERDVEEQRQALESKKEWYESGEFASRTGQARPELPETPVDQARVKKEVNDAQVGMGMEDHLHYVPDVESLPDRVKQGLTTGERNGTAQIVRDNKLGDIYVIGDRFSGLQELRRAIIEETQPYLYRQVSDMRVVHDPTDSRLGHYDPVSDRPTLNTHALLRTDRPFEEASRTALEEVNVHQGFTKLLGPRNGKTYVDAMNSVQRNFDRLKLNDILAQKKGFKDIDDMAKQYGFSDYKTNPRSQHALTEELIGAYAQTFRTPEGLAANAPAWYQSALRSLNTAIRSRLGLKLQDIDIQHLLADSASALRYPKYGQEGLFHPEVDAQAKDDMAQFQLANRRPEEEGTPPEGTKPPETADVGTEIIRSRISGLQRGLEPEEFIRQQATRLAEFDKSRSFRERMGLLDEESGAVTTRLGDAQVMRMARDMFERDLGGNVSRAMDYLREYRDTGPVNPALAEIITRKTSDQILDMQARGYGEQAKILEAKLDRFNSDVVARSTDVARELRAQGLRTATGSSVAAGFKRKLNEIQERFTRKPGNSEQNTRVKDGLKKVKAVNENAAGILKSDTKVSLDDLMARIQKNAERLAKRKPPEPGEKRPRGTTKSLPEQYTEDLVQRIDDAFNKVATVRERAPLEKVFDTFRKNIKQVIDEQVDMPELPKPPKPTAMDTLRQVMTNYPAYEQAWRRTVDQLQASNPTLFADLNRAVAEPVGEGLASKLAAEQGVNLSDLIYKHFSNVDRINSDLAGKISAATGLSGADASRLADRLQEHFTDIVKSKQQDKLQSILDAVGKTKNGKPAKGELAQLVDHIAIGSLDNKEWLNTVAPRFGMESYTPESIKGLKMSGDLMMRMRDEGLANSVIAQRVRQQITDLTRLDPEQNTPLKRNLNYILNVYTAGLLSGPLTHIPYWLQNTFVGATDSLIRGIQVMAKSGDVALTHQMFKDYWKGIMRGWEEFGPSLREGFRQAETPTWEGREGERMLGGGELEKMQFDPRNPYTWYSKYKYVRNFLEATSNLMARGTEYAMLRANYTEMAYDQGMSTADAWKYAEEGVYGSSKQQEQAHADAQRYALEYGLNKDATVVLENELLDRYKTKTDADLPDTILGDEERFRREDAARRSVAGGVRSTLRGDVPGVAGYLSRGFLDFANKYPVFRLNMPFLKVPFNLVNELFAWTPIGMLRGRGLLLGNTRGIEKYLGGIPGMEGRMGSEFGTPEHVSDAALHELQVNQFAKGLAGSLVSSALGLYINSNINNPDPLVRFTALGPPSFGQQQVERGKGWQEHSVKIGDHWFNYENTPFRSLFAALGAYEDYRRYTREQPTNAIDWAGHAAYHALSSGASSVLGSPLQGLRSIMAFVDREGGGLPAAEREVGNFLTQLIAAVPSTLIGGTGPRQLYRAVFPYEYETNDYISKLYRNIPVVNTMFLSPKLNVLGEPLNRNPINNEPLIPTNVPGDPVWQFLAHHDNIHLSMPGNQGKVDQVKMTPQEVYEHHKARGPALKAMIADAIKDPDFVNGSLDDQNAQIKAFEDEAKLDGDQAVRDYRETHPNPNELVEESE